MGTLAFPDLGKHCSVDDCKLIDFLPFTCDRCKQVFCLEHRSYLRHDCPSVSEKDLTVLVCPLCAKGVRLVPNEDPNITWDCHVNTNCDPENYRRVMERQCCPVPGCKESLTVSNKTRCRDCMLEHCLKHRFGPTHKCPGHPKRVDGTISSILNKNHKYGSKTSKQPNLPSQLSAGFISAASSVRASAESSMARLSTLTSLALQKARDGITWNGGGGMEHCLQCRARFTSITDLLEHVEAVHERGSKVGPLSTTIDVCPKCGRGFRNPAFLVEHVERDHGGTSDV